MITPQEIRERTFEKAVFGGYDMETVDKFMEELANDISLLQKENAVLKSKMKVLVDKVDEYRSNEDNLHNAILSAQKMGGLIEQEAKTKAEAILKEARLEAVRITQKASQDLLDEQARLEESRATSARFIDSMDMLCRRQLEFLQKMNELDFVRQLREEQAGKSAPANLTSSAQPAQGTPVQNAPAKTPAPAKPAAAKPAAPQVHERVTRIEETVAKAMDEPVVNVRPAVRTPVVDDERPTKSFNIITDPEDDTEKSVPLAPEEAN